MVIMVRTRGLGRALGRVIGRALGRQDHDSDGVPSGEGLPHLHVGNGKYVAEDAPEMTENVPAPSAKVADGGEGSPVDDAEGFLGGPRDPSVLTGFADHVALSICNGEERPELKLASHRRKVEKFGRPAPEIEGLLVATGLTPLIACSVDTGDRGVIFAFVERWHKETSSFHLPVGELTIMLDDVASLLHLSIIGAFHSFEPLHVDEAMIMLVEFLEASGEEARAETAQCHEAYVRLSWLRDIYQRRCEARHWTVAARAYLLHLLGCTLFANKSATHVHVVYLDTFRDLAQSGSYAWGAAALCWIYEYFPSVHESVTDEEYDETSPRACRWPTTKAYSKGFPASMYQTRIDALMYVGCLMVSTKELGHLTSFHAFMVSLDKVPLWSHIDWRGWCDNLAMFRPFLHCLWGDRFVLCLASVHQITWTSSSGSLICSSQPNRQLIRPDIHLSHSMTHVEPDIPEVPVAEVGPSHAPSDVEQPRHAVDACQVITKRLERVLNLRMVTAGTKLHDIMENCLRIARGVTSDGNVYVRAR
ncbi:Protein MAIN-LIKE 1 [Glycine soja]